MGLHTRLIERRKIEHPALGAPIGFVAGGALAPAVGEAAGLINDTPSAAAIITKIVTEAEALLVSARRFVA